MFKKNLAVLLIAIMMAGYMPMGAAYAATDNSVNKVPKVAVGMTLTAETAPQLSVTGHDVGEFSDGPYTFQLKLSNNAVWPSDIEQQLQDAMPDPDIAVEGYTYHVSTNRQSDTKLEMTVSDIVESSTVETRIKIPMLCKITDIGSVSITVNAMDSVLSDGVYTFARATTDTITAFSSVDADPRQPGYMIPATQDSISMGTVTVTEVLPGGIQGSLRLVSGNSAYTVDLTKASISFSEGLEGCSGDIQEDEIILDTTSRDVEATGIVTIEGAELIRTGTPQEGSTISVEVTADGSASDAGFTLGQVAATPVLTGTHSSVNKVSTVAIGAVLDGSNAPCLRIQENVPGALNGEDQVFQLVLTNGVWPEDAAEVLGTLVEDPDSSRSYFYHVSFNRLSSTRMEVSLSEVKESVADCIYISVPLISTIPAAGEAKVTIDGRDSMVTESIHTYAMATASGIRASVDDRIEIPSNGGSGVLENIIIEETTIGSMPATLRFSIDDTDFGLDFTDANVYTTGALSGCTAHVDNQELTIDLSNRNNSTRGSIIIAGTELMLNGTPSLGTEVTCNVTSENPDIQDSFVAAVVSEPYGETVTVEGKVKLSAEGSAEIKPIIIAEKAPRSFLGGRKITVSLLNPDYLFDEQAPGFKVVGSGGYAGCNFDYVEADLNSVEVTVPAELVRSDEAGIITITGLRINGPAGAVVDKVEILVSGRGLSSGTVYTVDVASGEAAIPSCQLKSLIVNKSVLLPSFSPGTLNYKGVITDDGTGVGVVAVSAESGSNITINGKAYKSGESLKLPWAACLDKIVASVTDNTGALQNYVLDLIPARNCVSKVSTVTAGHTFGLTDAPVLVIPEIYPNIFNELEYFDDDNLYVGVILELDGSQWATGAEAMLNASVKDLPGESVKHRISFKQLSATKMQVIFEDCMNRTQVPDSLRIPMLTVITSGEASVSVHGDTVDSMDGTYLFAKVAAEDSKPIPSTGGGGGGGGGAGGAKVTVKVNEPAKGELGDMTLLFEANSFDSEFQADINKVSYSSSPFRSPRRQLGSIYNITKNISDPLDKPMTLQFRLKAKDFNPATESIGIYYLDSKTNQWLELKDTEYDAATGIITGSGKLFTEYAVVVTPLVQVIEEPVAQGPVVVLKDIEGHWALAGIQKLLGKGAIGGNPDGTFQPEKQVTRAEFITMLVKALDLKGTSDKDFSDLSGHWGSGAVKTAVANGILTGFEDGALRPDAPITREQMAVMIVKATKLANSVPDKRPTDEGEIAPWALESVLSAMKAGIISGYADGSFRPKALATKAEAVTIIARCIK